MTEPVIDLAQRREAIRPDGSFLVQAPAGSGKTELLIQRYLRLLAVVEAPEEIVAITFTRKAAAEMRGRIIQALERISDNDVPADAAAQQTFDLAAAAMARNRERDWRLEHSPGRLRIQTIDSLCGALTRQMPVLSRLGAQPEIVEEPGELYERAAADTLAALEGGSGWSGVIAVLLAHLDNDLPRVRTMLAGMLARRDQWLRHLEGGIHREELEAALRHAVESTLGAAMAAMPQPLVPELIELLDYAAANLERDGYDTTVTACRGLAGLPPAQARGLAAWRGVSEFLLTQKGDWRKQADVRQGFPAAGKGKGDTETCRAMKARYKALLARLGEEPELQRQLQEIRDLPPPAYSEPDWLVVQALCELLKLADDKLRALFTERNQIDFTGVSRAAVHALGAEEAPTDLALSLDYRIAHILVDEFQDISVTQYTLLQRLTAGWTPGDGRSLFLVGDPMQSIYRFREAEVGLFLNTLEQRRLEQVAITPLNISVNFRSRAGIVDWVNAVFARVLPAADSGRGAVGYTPAVAYHDHPEREAVTVHPLIGRDEETEAELVIELIHNCRRAEPGGSIAVLVRSRTHLRAIVPRLKQAGLRFRAVDIEPLGTRPPIQDLMALTRALHQFHDRVAWLALLRAPWCGLTLEELLHVTASAPLLSVWECLQDDARLALPAPDARHRLAVLRDVIAEMLARRQRLPLSRWVESAWLRLGGPATLQDATDLENAGAYFRLLDRFDDGGDLRDRDGFLAQLGDLYAAADVEADGTLQIMTIHKAKGLEFDTVILPGLDRGSRNDENRLLRWVERPHRDHQDLLLAPVQEAGDNASPVYAYLKRLEKEKQFYEDGRLLYVAATRARRRLHLIGAVDARGDGAEESLSPPRAGSLLAQLWPVVEQDYLAALAAHREGAAAGADPVPEAAALRRLAADWRLPAPPPAVARPAQALEEAVDVATAAIEFDWAGESIRHVGTVVHRCLQQMAKEGAEHWDRDRIRAGAGTYRLALQRLGVAGENLEAAAADVAAALAGILEDSRGRWILADRHREARNEYALSGFHRERLVNIIIDRTFVDAEGTRWIIDYKTSRHEGGDREAFLDQEQARYRGQLERYAAILAELEDRPIRLGLYFPLLAGWREWGYKK